MNPKEELRLMAEEVRHAGTPTVFQTSRFRSSWQARVMSVISVVGSRGEVAILGVGTGKTEEAACADCLWYWAHRRGNPRLPSAGSLEELRLKLAVQEG